MWLFDHVLTHFLWYHIVKTNKAIRLAFIYRESTLVENNCSIKNKTSANFFETIILNLLITNRLVLCTLNSDRNRYAFDKNVCIRSYIIAEIIKSRYRKISEQTVSNINLFDLGVLYCILWRTEHFWRVW